MTPKTKAIELVDKFMRFMPAIEHDLTHAKQCALIAVDEMVAENESTLEMLKIHGNDRTNLPVLFRILFLKSAKEQIQQL